jgi:glycerophosphoryl diester phosphodiesterase
MNNVIPLIITCIIIFSNAQAQIKQDNFLIIAHRGASAYAPENTIAAFEKSIEHGADAVELDLRMTKDNVPVVLHDQDLDRTTNGNGDIQNFTLNEIKQLDAGNWFDEKFKGEKIPKLEEVFQKLKDTVKIIIEFKGGLGEYPGIEVKTLELIKEYNLEKKVILKSFDPNQLEKLRELNGNIPLLYVYAARIPWLGMVIDTGISFISVFNLDVEYLQPHKILLSKSFTKEAQDASYKIIAWGVNDEDDISEMIDYGVDGIETDYPDKVLKALKL